MSTPVLCHTCSGVFLAADPLRDAQNHVLDEHPASFGSSVFTDLAADAGALIRPLSPTEQPRDESETP